MRLALFALTAGATIGLAIDPASRTTSLAPAFVVALVAVTLATIANRRGRIAD